MKKKKLTVHIGANKTGSSAIQRFLSINCQTLRAAGVVVPDGTLKASHGTSGFHVFAFRDLLNVPEGSSGLYTAIRDIASRHPDAGTIVLSAENLAASPAAPLLFAGLLGEFDVQVILYVRRQDEYLLSSWQQWYSKISTDFWAWTLAVAGSLGNWQSYLEAWEAVVPRQQITVRIFERGKLEGRDVIADFYKQLKLTIPFNELLYPEATVNPSFSEAIMDLVKGNPLIFSDANDNFFYDFVQAMTQDRYLKNSRQSPITFAQRKAILGKYSESNRWVVDRYFPGTPGLFSPPQEEDYDYVSPEAMQTEKMEFLATMLYQMHQQGKS